MNIAISPKDPQTFATSCLDRTVKVWSLTSSTPNFTFDAHERGGVNFVEYHPDPHKPYIITTGDDRTIRIWDYLSKSCIQTLEGHTANVSFAVYLGGGGAPLIVSGSEDGMVKLWNAATYRLENTLNYGLERAWCVSLSGGHGGGASAAMGSNEVAIGFDEGLVVLKLGRDEPSYSMDSSGKLIFVRGSEVLTSNLSTLLEEGKELETLPDGSRISLASRELGSTEVFPTSIQHSPNGRFVTVVGQCFPSVYCSTADKGAQ
jgi:coatomer subunit beta'